jgi:chromosome segregation ATPase
MSQSESESSQQSLSDIARRHHDISQHGSESSSFARAEDELNHLQNEILGQGREIEEFIKAHAKSHKPSPAFRALMMLFDLFKSELSMNLALRQALMKEKGNSEACAQALGAQRKEIDGFLACISEAIGIQIPDLQAASHWIVTQLHEQRESVDEVKEKHRALKTSHGKLEREKANLQKDIESLHRNLTDQEAQFSIELARVTSRAELTEKQAANLKSDIAAMKTDLRTLQSKNEQLSQKLDRKKTRMRSLKSDLAEAERNSSAQVNQLHAKLRSAEAELAKAVEENDQFREQMSGMPDLEGTIRTMETKLSKVTQENKSLRARNAQLDETVESLQSANHKLTETRHSDREKSDRVHHELKLECDRLRRQLKDSEAGIKENERRWVEEQERIAAVVKEKLAKLRTERDRYRTDLEQQKHTQETAMARISELRTKIQTLEATHEGLLSELQRKAKEQIKVQRAKARALEVQIEALTRDHSGASREAKRLSSQLRAACVSIQKLEAENARLLTLVDKLRREVAETRGIAQDGLRHEARVHVEPKLFVPVAVSSSTEEETSSEPYRPNALASILSHCNSPPELRGSCPPDSSRQPIDFHREINSLQKEIESLKLELVSQ